MKRPLAPIPALVSTTLIDHQAGFKGQDIQAAVIWCQSTTETALWLNRLVNKHHTHTGRELGYGGGGGAAAWGSRPQVWTKVDFNTPHPTVAISSMNNTTFDHHSSARVMAQNSHFVMLSLIHTQRFCICLTSCPGSSGDSSDGKTEGFFLSSNPGVPPLLLSPIPHPLSLLCLSSCGVGTTQMF